MRQVFAYDDETKIVRQLPGPSRSGTYGVRPTISADGNMIAYKNLGVDYHVIPDHRIFSNHGKFSHRNIPAQF